LHERNLCIIFVETIKQKGIMATAKNIALRDIAQELKCGRYKPMSSYGLGGFVCWENWNVTTTYLDTKKNRRLNRELGLWSINKGKHNMNRNNN
jgi:hypothetical protein